MAVVVGSRGEDKDLGRGFRGWCPEGLGVSIWNVAERPLILRVIGFLDGTSVGEVVDAETPAGHSGKPRTAIAFGGIASCLTKGGGVREVRNA